MTKIQPSLPAWIQLGWSEWIGKALARAREVDKLDQKAVAAKAGIDASYLTHMKNGLVPRRDMVEALGEALGRRDEALLYAGYLPHKGCLRAVLAAARKKKPCHS